MSYTMVLCVTNNRYVLDTKYMCAYEILLSMNDLSGTGTRRRIVEVSAQETVLPVSTDASRKARSVCKGSDAAQSAPMRLEKPLQPEKHCRQK